MCLSSGSTMHVRALPESARSASPPFLPGCTAENWNGCDKGSSTSCNSSHPSSFAPSNLNVSSWVESLKAIGATHAVLTAKHGCDGQAGREGVRVARRVVAQRVVARRVRSSAWAAFLPHHSFHLPGAAS